MKPRQKVSKAAIELIKQFEGYRRSSARLADGGWTVGYGHTKFARENVEITEKDAEALLIYDLIEITGAVSDLIFTPLTQNQFDALSSFVFNIGLEGFKDSDVLMSLNEGDLHGAAWGIETWRRSDLGGAPIVVDALIRRRAAEKALFLTPQDGFVPTPTPVVPAKFDPESIAPFPARDPRSLIAPLDGPLAQAFEEPREPEERFPTLTETADAVTARLREILPDEEAAAPEAEVADAFAAIEPAAAEIAPAEAAAAEPAKSEPGQVQRRDAPKGLEHVPRVRTSAKGLGKLIGLSVAGVLAFGFAIFWKLNSAGSDQGQASAQAVSYLAGIAGIVCIFAAAAMLLDRLSGEDR